MRIGTRKHRRGGQTIALNLASMIDVVFLLLLYFLVTTTLAAPEDRLSTALQSSQPSTQSNDFRPQIVEVELAAGVPTYRLGSKVMTSREELMSTLAPLPKDAGLFIKVHDGVPVGFAIVAVQVGKDIGFEKVTYVPAGANQ